MNQIIASVFFKKHGSYNLFHIIFPTIFQLFPSLGGYMLKNTEDIIFLKISFPIIPMGAIRYSCTIRLVPTYILPAKGIRLLGKIQPDNFAT